MRLELVVLDDHDGFSMEIAGFGVFEGMVSTLLDLVVLGFSMETAGLGVFG